MSNTFYNRLRMKGLTKLPIFQKDGKFVFHFGAIIPMPESLCLPLDAKENSVIFYLTDRGRVFPLFMGPIKADLMEHILGFWSSDDEKVLFEERKKAWAALRGEERDELEEIGKKYVENYKAYGVTDFVDWGYKNWRTKGPSFNERVVNEDEIEFETANGVPTTVIQKLSQMYPDTPVEHTVYDRDDPYSPETTFRYAYVGKAVDIQWDVDEEDGPVGLPDEILIPDSIDIDDEDGVSDYITGQTGFCHNGFRIVPIGTAGCEDPGAFKCPYCGGTKFYAHQLVRMDVMVDGNNNWLENVPDGIYDSEEPYGPYTCAKCGHEFDELKEEHK